MERLDEQLWSDIHTFTYSGIRSDMAQGIIEFDYLFEGNGRQLTFTDTLTFTPPQHQTPGSLATFTKVVELLYVAVGTIYYKSIAPPQVNLGVVQLAPPAFRWASQLYRSGLAEFAYRWTIPHILDLELSGTQGVSVESTQSRSGYRPLVAIGGGKDSVVSLEALKAAGHEPATYAVQRQTTPVLAAMMARGGGPSLTVGRTMDKEMTRLLRANKARIGHVPVTAINSLAGVAMATLYGWGPVVMSNERSADEGNLTWRGHSINHQWSKGLEAESLLRDALRYHCGLTESCFSLLRGLSELHIARLFAATTGYDELVTSCNFAFRSDDRERVARWCTRCAKCRFIFLALAPFMSRDRLVGIFDADLLSDPEQLQGYRELLGLAGHKPFECVGEVQECRVAAELLTRTDEWAGRSMVQTLAAEVGDWPGTTAGPDVFTARESPFVPDSYADALRSFSSPGVPA